MNKNNLQSRISLLIYELSTYNKVMMQRHDKLSITLVLTAWTPSGRRGGQLSFWT